jgi:hypothetical protein
MIESGHMNREKEGLSLFFRLYRSASLRGVPYFCTNPYYQDRRNNNNNNHNNHNPG